jgi:hypothetical protein
MREKVRIGDRIYKKKVDTKRKSDILEKWDGYTSDQLKRDDRIQQVIN